MTGSTKKRQTPGNTSILRLPAKLIAWLSWQGDMEHTYRSQLAAVIGLIIGLASLAFLLPQVILLFSPHVTFSDLIVQDYLTVLAIFLTDVLALALNRAGRIRAAAWLLVLVILLMAFVQLAMEGRPTEDFAGLFGLLAAVVSAVILLGRREGIAVFTVALALLTMILLLWLEGRLPDPAPRTEFELALFSTAIWFIGSAFLVTIMWSVQEWIRRYGENLEQSIIDRAEELIKTREQIEVILSSSPDSIILMRADGLIDACNRACEELFGYEMDELYSQPPTLLVAPADVDTCETAIRSILENRQPVQGEFVARRKDGMTFDAHIAVGPFIQQGELHGLICVLRDISAFKEIDRLKDSFLSTAAHELRNPLTTIQGFIEILITREVDAGHRQRYMQFVNRQAEQLGAVINDLLDVSKLEESHGMDLEWRWVDMEQIINDSVQPYIESDSKHRFHLEGLDRLPPIRGDLVRLKQVIDNLVSNAAKYSPEGGTITIRGRVTDKEVIISVADEGIGIHPRDQERIFERFYRVDEIRNEIRGTGLGLAITRLIVDLHGGRIWLESTPGEGSTFAFAIPLPG